MTDSQFDEYVRARWPRLVRAAIMLGCDRHAAEDLAQTVLARAASSWNRISNLENPDAYVQRMLANARRDHMRRRASTEVIATITTDGISDDRIETEVAFLNSPLITRLIMSRASDSSS